jgi:predicted Zn-dependent protease
MRRLFDVAMKTGCELTVIENISIKQSTGSDIDLLVTRSEKSFFLYRIFKNGKEQVGKTGEKEEIEKKILSFDPDLGSPAPAGITNKPGSFSSSSSGLEIDRDRTVKIMSEMVEQAGLKLELAKVVRKKEKKILYKEGFSYENETEFSTVILSVVVEQDGKKQSSSRGEVVLDRFDPENFTSLIIEKAKKSVGEREVEPGNYACLFHRDVTTSILHMAVDLLNGKLLVKNSSCFGKKLGEKVTNFSILEDTTYPVLHKFDHEGIELSPKYLIENGVLKNFVLDRKSARKLGMEETGNSFLFSADYTNLKVLDFVSVSELGTHVVITDLISSDINETTGKFSSGFTGFLNDKPVRGTFSFYVQELLLNVEFVGEPEWDSQINSPLIFVRSLYLG